MSALPKIVQARLQAKAAEAHPDADVLTAFYEQVLPENERGPVLAHLAECTECRDVVGMALPEVEETAVRITRPASAWGWPQVVRWGSLVACLVVVGAAVMIRHPGKPEVFRAKSEADVIAQGDDLAAAAKDKAVDYAEPAAAQNLGTEDERKKALVALSGKGVRAAVQSQPAQPERIEPSVIGGTIPAGDQPKRGLDHPATAFKTSGAIGGARLAGNVAANAVLPPAMKTEEPSMANGEVANTLAQSVPSPDLKLADTPGRAKAGTSGSSNDAVAPEESGTTVAPSLAKGARASSAGASSSLLQMPAQFVLSPEGQLQRSFDSGKSWEPVPVVERAKFSALAVMGAEVWVGGAAGVLYHSDDNGRQWKLVKPSVADATLTADIMNVRFTDMQHLAVVTLDGQVWTTSDGGRNWQRQR